jgi:16S rRNA (guanine(966)-N(2))-methyltransferase RsmD
VTASATATAGRVIAGTARGVRLVAPANGVRPLGDRVKQTLFAILEAELSGTAFLDLFAGSGAAGIEALSRGAARATFVERNAAALAAIDRNLAATRLAGPAAEVVRGEAVAWLQRSAAASGPFGVIVADPPYEEPGLLADSLATISAAGPDGILAAGGVVVSKHFWRTGPPASIGLLASVRERRFGETGLTFQRWEAG